eukprot:ANDGO_06606.mRNA.1 hypothetical protein
MVAQSLWIGSLNRNIPPIQLKRGLLKVLEVVFCDIDVYVPLPDHGPGSNCAPNALNRGYAFIEFSTVDEAERFKRLQHQIRFPAECLQRGVKTFTVGDSNRHQESNNMSTYQAMAAQQQTLHAQAQAQLVSMMHQSAGGTCTYPVAVGTQSPSSQPAATSPIRKLSGLSTSVQPTVPYEQQQQSHQHMQGPRQMFFGPAATMHYPPHQPHAMQQAMGMPVGLVMPGPQISEEMPSPIPAHRMSRYMSMSPDHDSSFDGSLMSSQSTSTSTFVDEGSVLDMSLSDEGEDVFSTKSPSAALDFASFSDSLPLDATPSAPNTAPFSAGQHHCLPPTTYDQMPSIMEKLQSSLNMLSSLHAGLENVGADIQNRAACSQAIQLVHSISTSLHKEKRMTVDWRF